MSAEGRRGVVTGAASGIGRATALRLLREGVDVVAVDVDERGLADVAAAGARALVADLGTEEGCDAVVEAGAGGDYLVNAAGIIRLQPLFEVTRQDWRDQFRVNAESTFFLCQQLGPRLRDDGAIVNLSSVSAKLTSTPETAAYAATKTAILAVTRSFAYALAGRGIRVNAVCPGITDTPMQETVLRELARLRGTPYEEISRARNDTVPMRRACTPDEVAGVIWQLLGDDASYVTGEALNFSGGLAMW
ncbi:MAG TPA: SDR family oxidoreductase [Solirubrobacteraceae bacterium]|jgi:NAD(P)-dependent dehydrogenase (short-subunit alcohol dehydrogenase family)|nr:SDR family oxidoreductase [Solirubrobacteraceae bacterium]